ncbi:MAG: right-handed parallel beta-helix repeat-containing protein, partial [Methanosarcinales archaeon]|nr:right-handed parallel beta-helix repeat-containing protein [Methanosarcinales archaeon]
GKFINATNQSADAWLFLNFSYSDDDVTGLTESDLKVWKHNGTAWLEDGWNGTRYLDTTGNVVGANITSFSVFAPAASTMAGSYVPPDPTNLANTTSNYWVNYTWSVGASNVTDSYNVSLNGTWDNETADTFANTSVSPSGWANITVFAYNASGTGTLSDGNVSDNVQAPAAPTSCDCGDICVDETGWWRDGGVLNASGTPIQAAVDNATAGETICVAAGSYKENVDIATPHLTLTGEGAGVVTVTAADSNDHVFKVIASYVNISGFNATGATTYNGIHLGSADHCNISENTASNNHYGISLDSSSNNTLTGNTASSNNNNGIYLYDSSNNTLTNNTANSNIIDGIYLCSSSNNMLTGNNASSNDNDGIELYKVSNYNTLTNNNCSNNTQWDIYITGSDSTFSNNTLNGTTISFTYSGDVSLKGMGSPAADPA